MNATIRSHLKEAAEALNAARSVVTVGHVAPDADALGSALALARAARNAGKEAASSFGEPFVVPDAFRFLPVDLLVPPEKFPEGIDVAVAFDAASADRLGSLRPAVESAETLIVVDHHASNEGYGDIQVIDPSAGASGQLAFYLLEETGWDIDRGVATALLAAIVADTGRFQYSSTSPELLRVAALLLERGARPEEVGQNLFERVPYGYLAVASAVLGRAALDGETSLVWSVLYRDDLEQAGISYEDADPLIDQLRIAREAEVALLIKEVTGGLKGSLRSRGAVDVGTMAVALGGGGHHNASGFDHPGPVEDVVSAVKALLRD